MITKLAQEFAQQTQIKPVASTQDVKDACTALGISDWTTYTKDTDIPLAEAKVLLSAVAPKDATVPLKAFQAGLKVELEHGSDKSGINLTNNHPVYTAQIALAHLKESSKYYEYLEKMEDKLDEEE